MSKGKLIVIEGTDSSGKETQAKKLIERLTMEGIPCETMGFPRYQTPTGRIVGQCYLGKKNLGEGDTAWFGDADSLNPEIASLYYAADRMAAKEEMLNVLDFGTNLVLDRYVSSNMGHQGGKESNIFSRRKIINFIEKLEYGLLGLPRPDSIIFLYMPFEVGMGLRENKNEIADRHESNIRHLKRAEESYLRLAEEKNWTKICCAPDGTIDSLRTPEDIGEEVYQKVEKMIKQ